MIKGLSLALLISGLLSPIASLAIASPAIASSQIKKVAKYGPWQFSIQNLGSVGRTMKNPSDEDSTLEAAGHWVSVRVRITNTSKNRQSAKNLILTTGSKLIGAKGVSYNLDDDATGYIYESYENKPFSPGESRDIQLFFDTPKNESFRHLEVVAMNSLAPIRLAFR